MTTTRRKWKRLQHFLGVLSMHGFQELVQQFGKEKTTTDTTSNTTTTDNTLYIRIRKVLEELGPTFVKLGQAFANREDILPKELTIELQKLQDNVAAVNIDVLQLIRDELHIEPEEHFAHIELQPIAAASIAQVYTAQLASGEDVVLKIKRPNIQPVIEEDLMVIKMFAHFLKQHFVFARKMHLYEGILSFEGSILQELSFVKELQTIQQFQQCYKDQNDIHIPKTYEAYSTNEIICMEYIKGAKITDQQFIQAHGLNKEKIALLGLHTYLDQILNFGIFHADPHAGNILIQPNGTLTFIDFGTVGTIAHKDRLLLEDFILYLLTKNTTMLIATLKKIALDVKIENEKEFEREVVDILDMIQDNSLDLVDPKIMLEKFKNLVHKNDILLPSYLYLLVRGVMLIESIGRSIYPEMNLMSALQPYLFKIIKRRLHWRTWGPQVLSIAHDVSNLAQSLPKQIQHTLQNLENGDIKLKVVPTEQQQIDQRQQQQKIIWLALLGIITISSVVLYKDIIIASKWGTITLPVLIGIIICLALYKIFKRN